MFSHFCDCHSIGSRLQMLSKMDVEHAAFKTVLKRIKHDEDWDPEDPMEVIWIKMNETRYKLSGVRSLSKAKDQGEGPYQRIQWIQGFE